MYLGFYLVLSASRTEPVCTVPLSLQLSEVFESEIDGVMKGLGFCCGRKYVFYPNVLVCYGKSQLTCTIAQYQTYYAYQNRFESQ